MKVAIDTPPPVALPTRRQWAIGSAVAIAVAAVALAFFILPAEAGIDPTGFGERSGLIGLSRSGPAANIYLQRGQKRSNVLYPLPAGTRADEAGLRSALAGRRLPAPATPRSDRWTYELLPYESIEMKYRMAQGAPMVFTWKASAPVSVDEHSVPDAGGNPATESYVITTAAEQSALYVAPFTGIHGWYWQNQSLQPVTLTVDATGGFTGAVIFNQAGEHPRELQPASPSAK